LWILKPKEEITFQDLNGNFYYSRPRQTYGIEHHPSLENYEIKTNIEFYPSKFYESNEENISSIPGPGSIILLTFFIIYGKFKKR
jgi:hypothetical protein